MEYFLGSVKIMLIVYALAAVISMLVAGVIKLVFVVIRRRRVSPAVDAQAATGMASSPVGGTSAKAV